MSPVDRNGQTGSRQQQKHRVTVSEVKNSCFRIRFGGHLLSVPRLLAISVHRSGGYCRWPHRSPPVHNIGTAAEKWNRCDATTECPQRLRPELPPPFILLSPANVSQPPTVTTAKPCKITGGVRLPSSSLSLQRRSDPLIRRWDRERRTGSQVRRRFRTNVLVRRKETFIVVGRMFTPSSAHLYARE